MFKWGAGIKLNKEAKCMKCNYNLIYMGTPVGDVQHKFQEGYEALAQGYGRTIRDSQT